MAGTVTNFDQLGARFDLDLTALAGGVVDVRGFGARGDGVTDDAVVIQRALNQCAANGGGIVRFQNIQNDSGADTYLFGTTLTLPSNVVAVLDPGVTLKWGGSAAGTMFTQSITGGPNVQSGVIGAHGGPGIIDPTSASGANLIFDLHSPQGCVFRGLRIKNRTTTTVFKIQTDVASTTGALDGTQNALHNIFDHIFMSTCATAFSWVGTVGKVCTLNHIRSVIAGDVRTIFADHVDYSDSNVYSDCRALLNANNAIGFRFQTVNCYNNQFPNCAIDTFAGPTGRVVVSDSATRNQGYIFNNPRCEGQPFTGTAASYLIAAHSVDPDGATQGIELHKKGVVDFGVQWHVRAVTINDTATAEDVILLCNATGAAFAQTLPSAANKGQVLHIKKTDVSANAVTITRAGADTIQGSNTVALAAQYNSRTLVADGTSTWYVVAST